MPTERKRKGFMPYVPAIVFLGLIVLISGFKFRQSFRRVAEADNYRTNLVWFMGDSLNLVSIEKGQMTVFKVPERMMVPVVGMQGDLRSEVLRKFSQTEKEPLVMIRRSVELLFGSVLDGVVETKTSDSSMADQIKGSLLSWRTSTDLGLVTRVWLYWNVGKLLPNQIKIVEIPQTLGVEEVLPDGTKVVRVDRARLNLVIDDGLSNDSLLANTARVIVENASGVDNMGALVEKMVKTAGGFVVEVKTDDPKDGWCRFGLTKETQSQNQALVWWLSDKLRCENDSSIKVDNSNEIRLQVGRGFGEAYIR